MPPLHSLLLRRPSTAVAAADSAAASSSLGFKWVRDRGLDHAVEREKSLIPLLNTKNLLVSEPSKSLPISSIADRRSSLRLPCRPVDFLRRFPSVFRESPPAGPTRPHFALTAAALDLHAEELLIFRSDEYRRAAAARLLRLLMLCRANRLPIAAVDRLRWDLGLPEDFERSLVPDFPDYFRVAEGSDGARVLELVCWIGEFGSSVLEKRKKNNGDSIRFETNYSRGFEMEKKYKKWVEDWQNLPYFSPYEDFRKLSVKSDESDRWAVSVLHELLHILVPKKTEKENAMWLGDCLGLRGRLKRAMLQHPGIFYVSSKNDTYTLVLKEGYKRGVLVEDHPLMRMRSKYIHLMNSASEESKTVVSVSAGGGNEERKREGSFEGNDESEGEDEGEVSGSSEDEEEGEDERRRGGGKDVGRERGRRMRGSGSEVKERAGNSKRGRLDRKHHGKNRESEGEVIDSSEDEDERRRGGGKDRGRDRRRTRGTGSEVQQRAGNFKRERSDRKYHGKNRENEGEVSDSSEGKEGGEDERRRGGVKDVGGDRRGRRTRETGLEVNRRAGNFKREKSDGKHPGKNRESVPHKFSLVSEKKDRWLMRRSGYAKSKGSSVTDKAPS